MFLLPLSSHASHTVSLTEASKHHVRALAFALPGRLSLIPLRMVLGSHSSPGIRGPRKDEPFLSLTLKAQIFPVISMEGTVKLGASQLLIDGLEDSAMCWVSAIQATCPKTHPCFC